MVKKIANDIMYLVIGALMMYFIAPYLYTAKVIEKEKIVYKTEWRVNPDTVSFEDAVGCLKSPITIDTKVQNDVMVIHARDNCKESRLDVRLKCASTGDWQTYLTIGGICLAGGVGLTLYLLH